MRAGFTMEEFRGIAEERLGRLEGRMDRVEAALEHLEVAQARAEQNLETLTARVDQLTIRMDQLTERVDQLTIRMDQLAERVDQLTIRMDQLTARVDQLTIRMDQLTARVDQLAQAQTRTEQALQQLAIQVGALSENVGYGLEDIARVVLPSYLKQRYGIQVERLERHLFQVDGQVIDVDLYGEGKQARRRVVVLGEVKSRIYAREVSQFQQLLQAVRAQLSAQPVPLMFGYFIDLSAMEAAKGEILLIASYQPAVESSRVPPRPRRKRR
ncbi:MAG: hypothetical protein N3E42_06025 [Candidatus Bipolaricaulota bacterium]|nr:hypothetical protein [Candidatus Bipolaricaulota bacterium]